MYFRVSMQESDQMGKQKNKKKQMNMQKQDYEEIEDLQFEMGSSNKLASNKEIIYTQGQGISTLMNNIGSQMSGFTPSINTGHMPSQQSNYVHYNNKKKKRQLQQMQQSQQQIPQQHLQQQPQLQSLQQQQNPLQQQLSIFQLQQQNQQTLLQFLNSNLVQSSSFTKIRNSFHVPQNQLSYPFLNMMGTNIGTDTIIHNGTHQNTYQKTFDQYTRDTQPVENMNPFENQFDKQKDYKIYFPDYNLDKIMQFFKRRQMLIRLKIPKYKKDTDEISSVRRRQKKSTIGQSLMKVAKSPLNNQIK